MTNLCKKCGHEEHRHGATTEDENATWCFVGSTPDDCGCRKFEAEEPTSACCNVAFIEESDVCSKCKEHSEEGGEDDE